MIKLSRHGSRAFTLLETLIVLSIVSLIVSFGSYVIKDNIQVLEYKLFIEQMKHMLDRTQLLAISSHQPISIRQKQNSFIIQTDLYGQIQFPIAKQITKTYQQSPMTYWTDGTLNFMNNLTFYSNYGTDTFQYQLFYGHYRYEHQNKK